MLQPMKKAERAELFDFSSYPQGKDTYLLYTTREHTELTNGDILKPNGCKIGVADGSFQEVLLMEWLENNHSPSPKTAVHRLVQVSVRLPVG